MSGQCSLKIWNPLGGENRSKMSRRPESRGYNNSVYYSPRHQRRGRRHNMVPMPYMGGIPIVSTEVFSLMPIMSPFSLLPGLEMSWNYPPCFYVPPPPLPLPSRSDFGRCLDPEPEMSYTEYKYSPSSTPAASATEDELQPIPMNGSCEKLSCPICLEDLQELCRIGKKVVATICGHVFCKSCLRNALRTKRSCPKCRRHITLRAFHPLYF